MIPKFRVWDKENKIMLVVNNICNLFWDSKFIEGYELVPDPKGKHEYELIDHKIDLDDAIIMESTGLFDISTPQKEIFEGDVVASTWFKDYYNLVGYRKLGKVIYRNGCFCIEYPGDVDRGYPPTILNFAIDVEIIGNIFENPELMEVGDDTEV